MYTGNHLYFYPYKSQFIKINGYHYHYIFEGVLTNHAVLLLHGNPTWGFYYRTLIDILRNHFCVIVPDHMGMGLSDKPEQYPYQLRTHIDNIEKLINHLHVEKIHLVMHDWGGLIGTGYAIENIHRVDKLVILNSAAFYLPKLPFYLKLLRHPSIGNFLVKKLNLFLLGTLIWGVSDSSILTNEVKTGYLYPYRSEDDRIGILRFLMDIPFENEHPTRKLLNFIDSNLYLLNNHPMLILWGMKDPVFKAKYFLSEWKNRFPSAIVHTFDAGHLLLEEEGSQASQLIAEFLL